MVTAARRAYALGFAPGASGNASVRVPGEPRIVIKAAGKCLGDMTIADTVLIDFQGRLLERRTAERPSSESAFHCAIYRQRTDAGAVMHLHPPHAVAFAAARALPPLLTEEARTFLGGALVLIPPAPPGSAELASRVAEAFVPPLIRAAIISEHGTITIGAEPEAALHLSEYLEGAARTACLLRQIRDGGDAGT